MKNLTWQNPEQLFVAQELINKVKSKCCGIKAHNIVNLSETDELVTLMWCNEVFDSNHPDTYFDPV